MVSFELVAKLHPIINFSVESDGQVAAVVARGLMAARRKVENGQATAAEHHAIRGRTPEASVIRTTMEQTIAHAQRGRFAEWPIVSDAADNSGHVSGSPVT
jgi:hypothetical protein